MKNSLETKLGIFVLSAVLAAWAIVENTGQRWIFFHHGIRISAQFNTVQDLKVGDRVENGRGRDWQRAGHPAYGQQGEVMMKLHDSQMVKTDSKAAIKVHRL